VRVLLDESDGSDGVLIETPSPVEGSAR
jgi:hypothetical protein